MFARHTSPTVAQNTTRLMLSTAKLVAAIKRANRQFQLYYNILVFVSLTALHVFLCVYP